MVAQTAPPPEATRPYTATEAAALLGVHRDTVKRNLAQLGGHRLGEVYLFPRHVIDPLVYAPPQEAAPEPPPIARARALLPLLSAAERLALSCEALASQPGR